MAMQSPAQNDRNGEFVSLHTSRKHLTFLAARQQGPRPDPATPR
jgi:hypothetical protein